MTEIVLDASDPDRLADFWCDVLDWQVTSRSDYEVEIAPRDDGTNGPTLVFLRSAEKKLQKLRLHLDLRPTDREHSAELERLFAVGAVSADIGQGHVGWNVLADPEGNEFCLLHPIEAIGE